MYITYIRYDIYYIYSIYYTVVEYILYIHYITYIYIKHINIILFILRFEGCGSNAAGKYPQHSLIFNLRTRDKCFFVFYLNIKHVYIILRFE